MVLTKAAHAVARLLNEHGRDSQGELAKAMVIVATVIEALRNPPERLVKEAVVYDMYEPDDVDNFNRVLDAILKAGC
jgi:hypothetical protein